MRKLTIELVRESFEKEGYILLESRYINARKKLKYVCPEGHVHSVSWDQWNSKGSRCPYCAGLVKKTFEEVRGFFEADGYQLLTEEYINSSQKLKYICPIGHEHNITWRCWNQGKRCYYCFGNIGKSIVYIKDSFEKEGYTLLTTEYINNRQKLKYICPNGHKHEITWADWDSGNNSCPICYIENNFGENTSQWKGGISKLPYCREWTRSYKEEIKERDSHRCLNPYCFGGAKRLHVHHIDYTKTLCGPDNLITVCGSCNSRANFDREWHTQWYRIILNKRYGYNYTRSV